VTTKEATLSDLGLVLTEGPNVLIYDLKNVLVETLTPFGSGATSVQAAVGFLTGGVNSDLVVADGPGGGQIDIYNGLMGPVAKTITPYGPSYVSGLNIALGNVLSANPANIDIVVAPGGAGKGVAVFSGTGSQLSGFIPYANAFPARSYTGGLNVAVGNFKGTGPESIVLGTNAPQTAYAQTWNYSGGAFVKGATFNYKGQGAYVSTYSTIPGGIADLVVGTDNLNGTGALSQVYVQNGVSGKVIAQIPSNGLDIFDFGDTGPVRVGVVDINPDGIPYIVATTAAGPLQEVRIFALVNNVLELQDSLSAADLNLTAGYFGGLYVG
jgi:hypothetical protein